MLYKAQNEAGKFQDDQSSMLFGAKSQVNKETKQIGIGLKILTPKQMLQRL